MTLKEYRESCWPNYNPYNGPDKEKLHLDYLNDIWADYPIEIPLKIKLGGVPLGKLNLKSILF